jgi:hypothetical protein
MPGKKVNQKAAEYAAAITGDSGVFVELAVRRLSQPFTDDELKRLASAGYEKTDGDYSVFKDGVVVTKVQVEADADVFVALGKGKGVTAYPTLAQLLRPAHVDEFVADLKANPEKWSKADLFYRGHNLFNIYTSKQFNELVEGIIRNDEELRDCKKCDTCKQMFKASANEEACRKMIQLLEKCAEENRIPPEKITMQEVYLGYVPDQDMFVTAWDVWGSDSTGSVVIAFRIDEDGNVRHHSHDEYDRHRDVEEIYDASNLKFYEKPKQDRGPAGGRSLYECMSQSRTEGWSVVDIRLD